MNPKTKFSSHWLIVFCIALFVACVAPPAQAQHDVNQLTLSGVTTGQAAGVVALATNVYDSVVVTRGQHATLQIQFDAPASSTSNLIVRVDTSVDNGGGGGPGSTTNWFPNVYVFPITAAGVVRQTFVTNVNVGAVGYLRVALCNTNAVGTLTNIVAKVAQKPGI